MGLKNKICIAILLMIIGVSLPVYAAWQGPTEIISGTWGENSDQFGIEYEDTNDRFPTQIVVLLDEVVIVRDIVNGRRKIYAANGNLLRAVQCTKNTAGEWNDECRIIGNYIQTSSDGNIWTGPEYLKQQAYTLYSPTGQIIKTSAGRPLELGRVNESKKAEKYQITVQFPDKTYSLFLSGPYEKYVRDSNDHLTALSGKSVKKFDYCGKEIGSLVTPENQHKKIRPGGRGFDALYELIAETGEPVVAPNGDVYTWKRTPDKYSILKWTWVDDPNVPTGPDAPTGLSVMPSTTGLYLTWTASPQDPGCVTGYEIARATSAGGAYSTVTTVDKGVVKYSDTSASAGTTYYYKVRAVAGSEYSEYTSPVSGKK